MDLNSTVKLIAPVVTGLLLASCGEGSGEGSGGTGGAEDTFPPTVIGHTPVDNATDVPRGTELIAMFSEPLRETSIDGSSFTLRDDQGLVSASVSYDSSNNTAVLTPDQPLSLLTSFTATLSTAITDAAGIALTSEVSWSFATGDGAWGAPELVETDDVGVAVNAQIAFDSNGNAIAVWTTGLSIWANRYALGSGWDTAAPIGPSDGSANFPQIAFDGSDNAIAVWHQFEDANSSIWFNRYTPSGDWGTADVIEGTDESATRPQIAVDLAGNALAVWQQDDGVRENIWANRYTAGMTWGMPDLLETNAGGAVNADIAMDRAGNAAAVWQQNDGTRSNIWTNRYADGAWGTADLIETNDAGGAQGPSIVFDGDGNALAGWQQFDGLGVIDTWTNLYTAGDSWGTPDLLEMGDASSQRPRIEFDGDGNALAVWGQRDGDAFNMYANRYADGEWGMADLIETDDTGDAFFPSIAVHPSGHAIAVWHQSDGERDNIWANRYIAGDGWGTPEPLDDNDVDAAQIVTVAIDNTGSALAVWQEGPSGGEDLWSSRFE